MRVILLDGLDVRVVSIQNACSVTRKSLEIYSSVSDNRSNQNLIPVVIGMDEKGPVGFNFQFTPGQVPMINVTGLPAHLGVNFSDMVLLADREVLMFGVGMPEERKAG